MQKGRTSKLILSFLCAVLFIACDLFYSPPGVLESSRQAGTYLQPIAITLSSNHSKAIHYTTDGSLPTLDSPRYTTPITLTKTTQVQAIAIDSNDKVMQRKSWNYIVRGTPHFSPTLSVAEQRIYHVSDQYEYSADDGNTWQACTGLSQSLPELSVGNKVHVRHKVVQDDSYYLGEVLGLSGPDLVAGNCYVAHARLGENEIDDFSGLIFDANFSDGNATIAIPTITNAGNATFTGSAIIDFYASSDPFITEEDLRFLSMETINFTLEPNQTYGASQDGSWPTDVIWLLGLIKTVDKVPQLLYQVITLEGFQYIGYHLRTEESELLSQNNWTASQHVDSVFFAESNTTTSEGAFKIVNSYGVGETWEHIPDGAYYLPFDAAVALKLRINYSFNTFETVYEPFLFASFTLSHPNRETCLISIGVGEPEHPLMVKRLQSISDIANDDPVLAGGPNSFPDTKMVMDISEFAPYIATNDIFIRIDNRLGAETATLFSFSVELYDDYSLDPADAAQILDFPLEGSSPTVAAGENRTFLISTSRDLEQDSLPLLRTQSRSRSSSQSLPAQRPLTEEEIQDILALQAPA
ncbi:MAG: chitobiase/beta-hexosaminidase C-terminal domain-containing protein, partial [Sphaerochaeta sp.]|nr:chitobiase/beta-hexosaminidase C-terminal domain-containing protein [Sphaerochaeta sp.]